MRSIFLVLALAFVGALAAPTSAIHKRDTTSKENSCLKNIPGTFGLTATLADGTVLGNPAMIDGGINGQDLSTLVMADGLAAFKLIDGGLSYLDEQGNVAAVNNFITFQEPLGFAALESKDLFDFNDFRKRRSSSVPRAPVPPTATAAWCATSSSNDDPFAPYTLSLNSSPDVFFACSSGQNLGLEPGTQILSFGQPSGVSGCQNVLLIANVS